MNTPVSKFIDAIGCAMQLAPNIGTPTIKIGTNHDQQWFISIKNLVPTEQKAMIDGHLKTKSCIIGYSIYIILIIQDKYNYKTIVYIYNIKYTNIYNYINTRI